MIDLSRSRNLAVRPRTCCFHVLFTVPVLMIGLGFGQAGRSAAQTFTMLHYFPAASSSNSLGVYTNSDGTSPAGLVISSNNIIYAATAAGGSWGSGTIFRINGDGTGFTNLHDFAATSGQFSTNNDGSQPQAGLILAGNTLYGTAANGGSSGNGTVYRLNVDGSGFATLHSFMPTTSNNIFGVPINVDGANPVAGLVLSGNTLYGTTPYGGIAGNGTVFAIDTNGTGFTNLHNFTAIDDSRWPTNSDGKFPSGRLTLSGSTLFGSTSFGGSSGGGVVFALNTNGAGFRTLHDFTDLDFNVDGGYPLYGVLLSENILYGTTANGGSSGIGTLFRVKTDGTGFATVYAYTNDFHAQTTLVSAGNTLYGMGSSVEMPWNVVTVFKINTDGSDFTDLYSFTGTRLAWDATLILSGHTLYVTSGGWGDVSGSVVSISFTPQLTITPSAANLILTWPTNYAGFDYTGYSLQSTTNLLSSVWTTNLPAPVVVNGQFTVTNSISRTQQFFRLSQ